MGHIATQTIFVLNLKGFLVPFCSLVLQLFLNSIIVLITQSYQCVAEASSSFKWLGMFTSTSTMPIFNYITNNLKPFIYSPSQLFFSTAQYVYVHVCTPIFITEALHFVTQVQRILMTVTVNTALALLLLG